MKQNLLLVFALICLLGIAAGAAFFIFSESDGSTAGDPASTASAEPTVSEDAAALVLPDERDVQAPSAPLVEDRRARVDEQVEPAWDPQESVWMEAAVELPPGTPPNDATEIVALSKTRSGASLARKLDDIGRGNAQGLVTRVPVVDGRARLGLPPGSTETHLVVVGRYTYQDETLRVATDDEGVILRPELGAWVTGHLAPPLDASPEESALAELEIELSLDPMKFVGFGGFSEDRVSARKTDTADDLGFEFRGMEAGMRYRLDVAPETLAAARGEWFTPKPGERVQVDLPLVRGGTLSGRVVDEDGQAVAGAELVASQDPVMFNKGGQRVREGESAENGEFVLTAVAPGKSILTVEGEGFIETETSFELADRETSAGFEVVLGRGNRVAGTIAWPDGSPAASIKIELQFDLSQLAGMGAFGAMRGASGKATSDDQGAFLITGLGQGPFTVTAESQVGPEESPSEQDEVDEDVAWRARADGVKPGTEDLRLVLEEPLSIAGRVVDDRGEAVTKFRLQATRQRSGMLIDLGSQSRAADFEDPEGRFTLDGLQQGGWDVEAMAEAHGHSEPLAVELPGAAGDLLLRLPRAAAVHGVVLSPTGAPVAGAKVMGEIKLQDVGRLARSDDPNRVPQAFSNEEGRFELAGLPTGSQSLIASLEGFATSEAVSVDLAAAETLAGVEIRLRTGAHLTGTVFDDEGKPDVGQRVLAQIPTEVMGQRWTSTDAEGNFEYENMTPGTWQVMTLGDSEEADDSDPSADLARMMSNLRLTMVELEDGEEAHVLLGAPPEDPVRVSGLVTLAGDPVPEVFLSFLCENSESGRGGGMSNLRLNGTDAKGNYAVNLDRPGRYLVSIQRMSSMGASQSLELSYVIPEQEEYELNIALPTGAISGRISDADGNPVPDARLSLSTEGAIRNTSTFGGRYTEMTADAQGFYEVDWLDPGAYTIAAGGAPLGGLLGASAEHARQVKGVRVSKGERLEGVDFRLEKPGAIAGTVTDAAGAPVAKAAVFVRDEAGNVLERLSMFVTDASGKFNYAGLAPGRYQVSARDSSRASPLSPRVVVREGEASQVDIQLEAGTLLLVSISGKDGGFVEGAITVTDPEGRQVNGLFSLDQIMEAYASSGYSANEQRVGPLPPGRYKVTAETSDGRTRTKPVTLNGQPERKLNIRLK